MKRNYGFLIIFMTFVTGSLNFCEDLMLSEKIKSIEDVKALFPRSPEEIQKDTAQYIAQTEKAVEKIIAIASDKRTYQNTAKAFDDIVARGDLEIKGSAFEMMKYLHPDKAMRDMAQDSVKKIQDFFVDHISNNKRLYEAFKDYVEGNAKKESLSAEQQYFLERVMDDFQHAGLNLPSDQRATVKNLKKKLGELVLDFDGNIADDMRTIMVSKEGLAGLTDDFIANLATTEDGNYLLGVDYPTFFPVMQHCDVENTRQRLFEAFSNRAYPANLPLLTSIAAIRHELAQLLNFKNFAALNLVNQMAHSPERVDEFLDQLLPFAQKKETEELKTFTAELPHSVTLTHDGKIKAWDLGRMKTHFKEKHFQIDERKIAEYFPMQTTINALLDIYRQFMSVDFQEISVQGLWHDEVRLVMVYTKDRSQLLGYLFLDLYPRPNKYTHAAHACIVPAVKLADGTVLPVVSIMMANFPKPSKDKPALLTRVDVTTFFHEFGHVMHAMLGATQVGSFAGTRVKTDFVEMPSQMLEEWLWDKEIIKKVSNHYKTGEPLPDQVIDNILALKRYDSGNFTVRQIMLSKYSLDLHKGDTQNPEELWLKMVAQIMPDYHWGSQYRSYASFGHLTGYAAKYYGYLWAKVFAHDLFGEIKKHGLLNPAIGAKYVQEVIGKGGSCDPNTLLVNFLGRQPSQEAFLCDMGLNETRSHLPNELQEQLVVR